MIPHRPLPPVMSTAIHRFISADFSTNLRGLRLVHLLRGITTAGQKQKGDVSFKEVLEVLASATGCRSTLDLPTRPQVAELLKRSAFSAFKISIEFDNVPSVQDSKRAIAAKVGSDANTEARKYRHLTDQLLLMVKASELSIAFVLISYSPMVCLIVDFDFSNACRGAVETK